ncbi:MAG TPA: glycosyltransferase family 2 protein [Burkholderiaceae bacterium]
MNRLLSICIPTYGRPELLLETASELVRQARPHDIALVISDNSEDDRTEQVARQLQASYPHVTYARNERNLGIDRNFLQVASMAQTEFIWFFGDDDRPMPGAIDRVLAEASRAGDVEFFLVNSKPMTPDMRREMSDNLTGIRSDVVYRDCNAALREVSWYSTFVGAFVVRLDAWRSVDPQRYLDTVFVHVGVMFEAMAARGFALKVISEPLICYRTGTATWSGNFLNIQFVLWKRTMDLLPAAFDALSRRMAVESVVERFVTVGALVGMRTSGNLNLRTFRTIVAPYLEWARKGRRATWRIALSAASLLLVPVKALQLLRRGYRRVRYGG